MHQIPAGRFSRIAQLAVGCEHKEHLWLRHSAVGIRKGTRFFANVSDQQPVVVPKIAKTSETFFRDVVYYPKTATTTRRRYEMALPVVLPGMLP